MRTSFISSVTSVTSMRSSFLQAFSNKSRQIWTVRSQTSLLFAFNNAVSHARRHKLRMFCLPQQKQGWRSSYAFSILLLTKNSVKFVVLIVTSLPVPSEATMFPPNIRKSPYITMGFTHLVRFDNMSWCIL